MASPSPTPSPPRASATRCLASTARCAPEGGGEADLWGEGVGPPALRTSLGASRPLTA